MADVFQLPVAIKPLVSSGKRSQMRKGQGGHDSGAQLAILKQ